MVSAKDLCAIIKACHKSGVTSLKFGDVEVTFTEAAKTPYVEGVPHETVHLAPNRELGETDVSMQLSADHQKLLEDMEVVDMSIEDPVAFENYSVDQLVHGGRSLDA